MYFIIKRSLFLFAFIFLQVNLFAQLSMPEISSVSVHPIDSTIIVKWKAPLTSENIVSHGTSRLEYPGSVYPYTLIGAEQVAGINFYIDTERRIIDYIHDNMSSRRFIYRVLARKSAQETSISHGHLTVKFRGEYNDCNNSLNLRWTQYRMLPIDSNSKEITDESNPEYIKANNFNNAIEYEVWGHKGPTLILANAVKLSDKSKNAEVQIHNLDINSDYQLFLKCLLPNGDTATSHQITLNTNNKLGPAFMNIDTIRSEKGGIKLDINIDRASQLDTFAIFRSDITNRPIKWFYSIADVPRVYGDMEGLSLGLVYSYKIASYRCRKIDAVSDSAKNVLLFTTPNDQKVRVIWSEVPNYTGTVSYNLERKTSSGSDNIDLSSYNLLYIDESVSGMLCEGPQEVTYKLTVDNGKTVSISENSYAKLSPIISVPNAIDPNRHDISSTITMNCSNRTGIARNEFGPIIDMKKDAYKVVLEIFNRAGIKLYGIIKDFDNPNDAFWNGYDINGKSVPEGTYFYNIEISFRDETQTPLTKRGTVTVMR